jgi:hypothetical protein
MQEIYRIESVECSLFRSCGAPAKNSGRSFLRAFLSVSNAAPHVDTDFIFHHPTTRRVRQHALHEAGNHATPLEFHSRLKTSPPKILIEQMPGIGVYVTPRHPRAVPCGGVECSLAACNTQS